jgi:hypothetical protein
MQLLHRTAADGETRRRIANVTRAGTLYGIVMFVLGIAVGHVIADSALGPSPAPMVSAETAPVPSTPAAAEPNEHDYTQRPYVTHGG